MADFEKDQIEKYLSNKFSDAERNAFEQELTSNSTLRRELELHRQALLAIRLKGREQLRQRWLAQPGESEFQEAGSAAARIFRVIIFSIIVISGIIWYWYTRQAPVNHSDRTYPDTITVKPTYQSPAPNTLEDSEKKQQQSTPDIVPDKEKLFANYFQPYRDESLNPIVRDNSSVPTSAFENFRQLYWNSRYPEALISYESLDPVLRENDNLLFLKANLLLATGQSDQSMLILEKIIHNNRSRYIVEAQWYNALCYLRKGDWVVAKKQLLQIAYTEGSAHRKDAIQILKKIR